MTSKRRARKINLLVVLGLARGLVPAPKNARAPAAARASANFPAVDDAAEAAAAAARAATPLEPEQLAEELAVGTAYWHDPRIHEMGNVGTGGWFAAFLGPMITKLIDVAAYDGRDIRAECGVSARAALAASLAGAAAARGVSLSAPFDTIVDIGCGTGASTRGLLAAFPGAAVAAFDTSPNFLAAARATTPRSPLVTFEERNGEATGLPAQSADVVSLQFILHEAPADGRRKLLAEAKRLLKPGGVLLLLDIAQEYEPSAAMAHGEPYVAGYLKYVSRDVHAAGFAAVEATKIVPGHATMWLCQKDLRPAHVQTAKNNILRIKLPTAALLEEDATVPASHLRVERAAPP